MKENTFKIDEITSWGFYLQVGSEKDIEELLAVRPEYVCRGFMDWGQPASDYVPHRAIVDRAHQNDILFEGGISFSPVRPRPGEMTAEYYDDLTTHTPAGRYVDPWENTSYRQGAIHNPRAIDWFLFSMARPQIEAGIDGLHVDEIEGSYPWRGLGFDNYAITEFRKWLLARYAARGWTETDRRWENELGVDLALHGGTMRQFDFIRHLQSKNLTDDIEVPHANMDHEFRFQREDTLGKLWGNAWHEKYAGTFQFDSIERYWTGAVVRLKADAARITGRDLIVNENMNWVARSDVDYTMAHGDLVYHNERGEFDLSVSCAARIEEVKTCSRRRAGDVPVVFFIDWGPNFSEMNFIPSGAVNTYICKLAAETAAAGTFFSLPINGGGYNAASGGYLDTCRDLAAFFRREKRLFLPGSEFALHPMSGDRQLTVRAYQRNGNKVVHLVNHATRAPEALLARRDELLSLELQPGNEIQAYSFEWPGCRDVTIINREGSQAQIVLPAFETYCVLEINGR